MHKGLLLLLFCAVLLAACGGSKAVAPVKRAYRVSFSSSDVVILDTSYAGYVVDENKTKLTMKLDHVVENMQTGGFNARLSIETQFDDFPVQGIIEPYVHNQPPPDYSSPLLISANYLDTLWLFSGKLDMKSGALSGTATTTGIGDDDPWLLSPL
jgi:hypothetical protein